MSDPKKHAGHASMIGCGVRRALMQTCAIYLLAPVCAAGWAQAQETGATRSFALEEIVVTSQKREERLQDVPLAVSVLGQSTLGDLEISKFDDINLPAIQISEGGANNVQFIRGIGSSFNNGYEQSAPIYTDGIWLGRSESQRLAFLDVQRIEVLKGPQPTYLGKNAIAGAISIVSNRPTREFEAGLDTMYEFEAEEFATTGFVSGPLSEKVLARFAGRYSNMSGYMKNVASGKDEPGRKDIAGRLSFIFDPSDHLSVFVKGEYGRFEEKGRVTQLLHCLPGGQFDPLIEDCTFNRTRASSFNSAVYDPVDNPFFDHSRKGPDFREVEFKSTALEANWDFQGHTVTLLTAYYKQTMQNWVKIDHSTRQRAAQQNDESYDLFSGELRIASPVGQMVEWLAGLYYDNADLAYTQYTVIPPMGTGIVKDVSQSSKSWSAFAEVAFNVTEGVKIKAAARYTEVDKSADATEWTYAVTPLINQFTSSRGVSDVTVSDNSFDPMLTLEWKPNDDYLVYASWREGFKAAGIDHDLVSLVPEDLVYDSETVTYYELGLKASVTPVTSLNLAIFRGDYKDLQTSVIDVDTGNFATTNAGKVRSQGVEAELIWRATESLTLSGAVAYLDAKYREFVGVACYANPQQTLAEGCYTVSPGVRAQDLTGTRTPFAPKWSGNISANLRHPLGFDLLGSSVDLVGRADMYLTSKYQVGFNNDPDTLQGGYHKIDARLGLAAEDSKWELAIVGRNLNNKLTAAFIGNQPRAGQNSAHFGITQRPREIMLQLKLRFH